ncbi:MAG: maleylpyruvate isomerase family mycothiol-dependent enzyme [Actinomycetota bacterium]
MTSLAAFLDAHRLAYDELNLLVSDLDVDQLATQSLCPDWDNRACIAHAVGVDKALTGWAPDPENFFDFSVALDFMADAVSLDPAAFATVVNDATDARIADLESMDPSIVEQPSMTPVGPQAYGNFLQIRIFDLWVHTRDVAIPLGIALPAAGPTAEMALNEVHRSMGYIAGKKIGLEDGMAMTVEITGDAARTIHVAVDGRAALVDAVDSPDVVLTADTETFVMLACGRLDPQQRIDDGRISWTGDDAWGDKAARNLRFTM